MRTVGIKLADGTFYPIMEEGTAQEKKLNLTTAHNNQTCVMVDLYRSKTCTMEDAEYIDTLKIENLVAHPNGEPNISFSVGLDDKGELTAKIEDPETGAESDSKITLVSRTIEERLITDEYTIDEAENAVSEEEVAGADAENTDNDKSGVLAAAGIAGGAGLLAAAVALNKKDNEADEETETVAEEPIEETESFDLPDIPDETIADETVVEESPVETEDFNISDISDETIADEPVDESFDIPDEPAENISESSHFFEEDSFDIPDDFDSDSSFDDDLNFDSDSSTPISESNGLSFTGLYDKETEMGDSSIHDDENDTAKNTKAPVIICIICAIICVIATLLVLFVIPSRCNLLKNKKNKQPDVEVVAEKAKPVKSEPQLVTPEPEPEPEVPEAKEDEIIVIEEAEKVVPLPPPVEEEKKPEYITYKIKWGDTLWDIADTYYKNPWRYKKIAKYNKIKNPDYIISGTTIKIPVE